MSTSHEDFNAKVIDEFRVNGGHVGGMFEGTPLLLLNHAGARSGTERINPVAYTKDGSRYVVIASKGGAPVSPGWYHNLIANPETRVEVGSETVTVVARAAAGEERDRLYRAMAEQMPAFAEYERKTERRIPVIVLEPA